MAINFANQKLSKIECDKISSDNNNVTNLISSDPNVRSKGFMAEYFINCPVSVTLTTLQHNFDLMFIRLGLKVRQHKSSGIEVYVINGKRNVQNLVFRSILSPHETDLILINKCYRPNNLLPNVSQNLTEARSFASKNMKFCYNIKSVIIKITKSGSVPCLRYSLDN